MTRAWIATLAVLGLTGCPNTPPAPPVTPEAGDASPCQVDEAITAARLIRTADGSSLALPPCPDGGQ